ncbi:MAG: TIR domain-containing protein [Ignavibacteriales bacterium]|nr:TIR domain-containing protein [Ignavibacteriales bacterium]
MKIFISYSQQDKRYADMIAERLKQAGYDVEYDVWRLRAGDNLLAKINEGIKVTDTLIVIVSQYFLQSKSLMNEFSAAAFGDISSKQSRILPVLVDKSTVPHYLAKYQYLDLTSDFELGIQQILNTLSDETPPEKAKKGKAKKRTYERALFTLAQSLRAGRLTLMGGAGVSIGAGIPSWELLLLRLLETMLNKISAGKKSHLKKPNADEFRQRYGSTALIIGKYLKTNLGNDFLPELRNALYADNPLTCQTIDAIVNLARPQRDGKPLDSIITFNFDGLIEENLTRNNIKHKSIYSEGLRNATNELPVYHVHGYLPRKGKIPQASEIVFSEDAYHTQFTDPFSWSNLIQLNKLSQNTCLLIGLSLSDPNLRRLLDVANRKNPTRALNHYVIKKTPNSNPKNDTVDELAFLLEEQDANELGLNVIWVDDFDEIPDLLHSIADYSLELRRTT